jgi:hypothetical protein
MRSLPAGACHVCNKEECFEDDLVVECDACGLVVHQSCYGVRPHPGDAPWLCDICKDDAQRPARARAELCALCGKTGGALKVTACGKHFAHLACVIWIPEAHVVNTTDMKPVEIRHIPWQRQKLRCNICKSKDAPCDAPVQCYDPTCAKSFHVGCARESGEKYLIVISDDASPLACAPANLSRPTRPPRPDPPRAAGGGLRRTASC